MIFQRNRVSNKYLLRAIGHIVGRKKRSASLEEIAEYMACDTDEIDFRINVLINKGEITSNGKTSKYYRLAEKFDFRAPSPFNPKKSHEEGTFNEFGYKVAG